MFSDYFKIHSPKKILYLNEDEQTSPEWSVIYKLPSSELDDEFEDTSTQEVIIRASDFNTAIKYAQQYLRKMQNTEDSKELWGAAEILSIELR